MGTLWQDILYKFRWQATAILVGLALTGAGILLTSVHTGPKVEILGTEASASATSSIMVEVSGAVEKPGVYRFDTGARIDDAISAAGGLSSDADSGWVSKYLNRAARLNDGQKIYIPRVGEQSTTQSDRNDSGGQNVSSALGTSDYSLVNINTASEKALESLKGIGPVTGKKIVDNRPYSDVNELVMKKIVSQKVFDDNKQFLTVY